MEGKEHKLVLTVQLIWFICRENNNISVAWGC